MLALYCASLNRRPDVEGRVTRLVVKEPLKNYTCCIENGLCAKILGEVGAK